MQFKTLIWQINADTGMIILNRPPSNIMDQQLFDELGYLTIHVIPQSQLSSLVIASNSRHFSAGADISELLLHMRQSFRHAVCVQSIPAE